MIVLQTGSDGQLRTRVTGFGLGWLAGPQLRPVDVTAEEAGYLAPELWHPSVDPGVAADVYALGVMLYHALTGLLPASGADTLSVARQHLEGDFLAPSRADGSIPWHLDALVRWALACHPVDRPQDCRQLALLLVGSRFGAVARPGQLTESGALPTILRSSPAPTPYNEGVVHAIGLEPTAATEIPVGLTGISLDDDDDDDPFGMAETASQEIPVGLQGLDLDGGPDELVEEPTALVGLAQAPQMELRATPLPPPDLEHGPTAAQAIPAGLAGIDLDADPEEEPTFDADTAAIGVPAIRDADLDSSPPAETTLRLRRRRPTPMPDPDPPKRR